MTGTLKGYDALMNLVLDDVQETVRGKLAPSQWLGDMIYWNPLRGIGKDTTNTK